MFALESKENILPIEVTQGRRYLLVITNLACNIKLQFRHLQDPTWYEFPDFDGTAGAFPPTGAETDVVRCNFLCPSPNMRLVLVTEDAHSGSVAPYYVSVIPYTVSEY